MRGRGGRGACGGAARRLALAALVALAAAGAARADADGSVRSPGAWRLLLGAEGDPAEGGD